MLFSFQCMGLVRLCRNGLCIWDVWFCLIWCKPGKSRMSSIVKKRWNLLLVDPYWKEDRVVMIDFFITSDGWKATRDFCGPITKCSSVTTMQIIKLLKALKQRRCWIPTFWNQIWNIIGLNFLFFKEIECVINVVP